MKKGEKFEVITQHPDIEFCKIVGGMDTNPFLSKMLVVAKSVVNGLLEVCTRGAGEYSATNISLTNVPFVSVWPNGDYKISVRFYDEIDDNIGGGFYLATLSH